MGKIKSVSHRKAPPTFIDDVLEKFRAHNEMEEQKVRQTSLPVPGQLTSKPNGLTCHDLRSMFARKLVDTQEESDESPAAADNKTLAILQQTGQVLQNLHQERIQEPQAVSQFFFKLTLALKKIYIISLFFNCTGYRCNVNIAIKGFSYQNSKRRQHHFISKVNLKRIFLS